MQSTSLPTRTTTVFAASGLRTAIPELASGAVGAQCSKELGYPPITMQDKSLGGLGPDGRQTNQEIHDLDAFKQWQEAGGYSTYNSAFSTAIGGYPKGAVLARADLSGYWMSTVESNTTNPDTGGAGWRGWVPQVYTQTGGAAGTYTLTPDAVLSVYKPNEEVLVKFHASGTGTDTIAISGLGAVSLKQYNDAGALSPPVIIAGQYTRLVYDGTYFIILDALPPAAGALASGIRLSGDRLVHTTYYDVASSTFTDVTDFSLAITVTNAPVSAEINAIVSLYAESAAYPCYLQLLVNGGEHTNVVVDYDFGEGLGAGADAHYLPAKVNLSNKAFTLAQNATYTFKLQAKNSASAAAQNMRINASDDFRTSRDPGARSLIEIVTYKA